MGDAEAGIQFIYHMREHIVDVGIATVYLIAVYAISSPSKNTGITNAASCGCEPVPYGEL